MILILSSRYVTTADQCLSPIRPTTSHLGSPVVRAGTSMRMGSCQSSCARTKSTPCFGSERALFLCPGHEHVDRGPHALSHLLLALGSAPGAQHHLTQSAVECLDLAHLLQRPGQPQPGVRLLRGLAHVVVDRLDHVLEQRVDQLFLVSEVPVDRADPQPRVVRDVVERRGDTAVTEHLTRGGQQAPPVALGIFAPRAPSGAPAIYSVLTARKPLLRTPIMLCPLAWRYVQAPAGPSRAAARSPTALCSHGT